MPPHMPHHYRHTYTMTTTTRAPVNTATHNRHQRYNPMHEYLLVQPDEKLVPSSP
ncbi:hypothetical protein [Dictyobacter alpinus]|uniref:hypothetical protein n=1 Tax=Dictyobacter alpinus TaxID=2014873 RepID=UPI00138693F7|nr:hypothetical protein [Dictyobacter alpinus]